MSDSPHDMVKDGEYEAEGYGLHVPHSNKKEIFLVFAILSALTAVEFVLAFVMDPGTWRTIIFLVLTVFKAAGIVLYFMHMKHELKRLMYSVLLPLIFVVYLVALLIIETQG
ncbi:MAG: cytochrome C oxidase subunit IV family protein [Bacteroidia bacterium]